MLPQSPKGTPWVQLRRTVSRAISAHRSLCDNHPSPMSKSQPSPLAEVDIVSFRCFELSVQQSTIADLLPPPGTRLSSLSPSQAAALLLHRRAIRQDLVAWCTEALAVQGFRPARHHLVLLNALEAVERGEFTEYDAANNQRTLGQDTDQRQ